MKRTVLSILAAALAGAAVHAATAAGMPSSRESPTPSAPRPTFRLETLAPGATVSLAAPERAKAVAKDEPGPIRIGRVRALPKAERVGPWVRVEGGHVAHAIARSDEAVGLRVRLDMPSALAGMEVRVRGAGGRVESAPVAPGSSQAWTPWTEGPVQRIEIFSPVLPELDAVRIGALVHFDESPIAKAASSCTLSTACSTGDAVLDAAIEEREKSVVRLNFVEGGASFLCSATLINTERFPDPFMLTANHCVSTIDAALSVSTYWFYEGSSCGDPSANPAWQQLAGGAHLIFTNWNADSTLLQLRQPPPAGAIYAPWDPERVASGTQVVSVSHPAGDTSRYAIGTMNREYRIVDRAQDEYGVRFSRGIIEGGSSGSGLFTLANGSLQLRGVLHGTTIRAGGMSCTNTTEDALYGRLDIFHPQIEPYITNTVLTPDDTPNRAFDWFGAPPRLTGEDTPLDTRGSTLALDNRRIERGGDVDVYRFSLASTAVVSLWSEGGEDMIGTLLDSEGAGMEANDDAERGNLNFGITRELPAGQYYLMVAHWEPRAVASYHLRMRADRLDTNRTSLWWNAAESGWGVNLTHQGNKLFATLFTYDVDGSQMWLVMSDGQRQADGSYAGDLFRTSGPVFNATPWPGVSLATVGTMRVSFSGSSAGTLAYTVNGVPVTKSITKQEFSTMPECSWSAFDRSYADNYQDLWWNPNEDGWGVNVTHQGDTLFATLFTYGADGRGMWLVMSNGAKTGLGSYSGTLYRTSGPAFNAAPWSPVLLTNVGSMSFQFSDGNAGTMTYTVNGVRVSKSIERQVFATPRTQCSAAP